MPYARDKQLAQSGEQVQKLLDAILPPVGTVQPEGGMLPNILYNLGTLSGDTIFRLAAPEDDAVINHYYWVFNVRDITREVDGETITAPPTVTFPADIIAWNGGDAPEIEADTHYEISVLNGIGVYMSTKLPAEED